MALDLGTLVGYLELDDAGIDEGVDGGLQKLQDFGSKGTVVAAAAGVAIAGAAAASLAGAMNVDAANDKLSAQLGLTEAESARIGDAAGSLYADAYGDSMEHVNQAVGAVMTSIDGMSNASSERLEKVTAKALDFATAFEVDVARSAQVAGQLIETGLADNATHAFDLLTAASQKVPAALREDVLDATDEYGQFFASLGYDGEQAFALLVDASEKGMYGIDKAGDAIKEFSIRATDMSKLSTDAYKAIGLDADEMTDKILKGGESAQDATQQVIDGLLGIKDPGEQAAASIALFGTPLEDLNVTEIPAFLKSLQGTSKSMDDTAGASKRMGDTLNDNATVALTSLKRQAEQAFQWLGNQAIPIVDDLAKGFAEDFGPALATTGDVLKRVAGFIQEHDTAAKALAITIGALVVVTQLHAAVLAVAAAGGLASFIKQLPVITSMTRAWAAVQWLINAALTANPIGIVVMALVGLGVALVVAYKKSETFRNIVDGAFKAVGAAGRWLWNQVLQPVFSFLVRGFATVMDMYAKMLRGLAKVPGFGWAEKAADGMSKAADKARGLADDIRKIPDSKSVRVIADVQAARDGLNSFIRDASGRTITIGTRVLASPRTGGPNAARARGGSVIEDTPYLVGEEGPELYVPNRGGRIIPHGQTRQVMARDHGPRIHAPIQVTMPATATPESAYDAAGGRIVAHLSSIGA